MNRQQRRELAKEKAVEAKYLDALQDRQDRVEKTDIQTYMMAFALALHEKLKCNQDQIEEVELYAMHIIGSIDGVTYTYNDLVREVKRKTDIEFEIVDRK